MADLNFETYKDANFLNNMAVFEWNIFEDKLNFDEQMKKILQRELPRENVCER